MGYILSFESVVRAVKDLRKSGEIIFTHGAYDLFHVGQSEFLKKSKEKGQILIVGIDSDKDVSFHKGIQRPVIPFGQRINIVSRFEYVDFAFPLSYHAGVNKEKFVKDPSNYYLNLYREIKPNLVTFGRKYGGLKTIAEGKKSLKSIKFKQIVHQYDKIQSTTKIIDKILLQKSLN